jgi:hypothetical protein
MRYVVMSGTALETIAITTCEHSPYCRLELELEPASCSIQTTGSDPFELHPWVAYPGLRRLHPHDSRIMSSVSKTS